MKSIRYFYRSYAVPGEALSAMIGEPMRSAVIARAHYCVYPHSRAIIYTGLDRTVPTNALPHDIIRLIAAKENLNPHEYSWFDLQTVMQDEHIKCGNYKFLLVLIRANSAPAQAEYVVAIECPDDIQEQFAPYICSKFYGDDIGFTPAEFDRWVAKQASDDDDEE